MSKVKKIRIFIIIAIIVLIFILIFKNLIKKQSSGIQQENVINYVEEKGNEEPVKNASMFFTVESCVNKYLDYKKSKNEEAILEILDNSYIQQYSINKNNINSYINFSNMKDEYAFIADKMTYLNINDSLYSYNAIGKIVEYDMDNSKIIDSEFHITVNINMDNNTFSIIPSNEF